MRPIRNCLNKQLTELCQRSVQLEVLSHQISQFLPSELAEVCQVGSFDKGCLVLTTKDASWASQLRFAVPELRDKLRKDAEMYQLSSIKITVTSGKLHENIKKETTKPALSDKAKAAIIHESEQCSYPPLKRALMHLGGSDY